MIFLILFYVDYVVCSSPSRQGYSGGYSGGYDGGVVSNYCYPPSPDDPYTNYVCPFYRPYCNTETYLCEECAADIHCRNSTHCNAVCRGTHSNLLFLLNLWFFWKK